MSLSLSFSPFLLYLPLTGIFAPLSKISKPSERCKASPQRSATPIRPTQRINLSRVTSKINTGNSFSDRDFKYLCHVSGWMDRLQGKG